MFKKLYLILTGLAIVGQLVAEGIIPETNVKVESPDGNLTFEFYQKELGQDKKQMYYTVEYKKQPVVLESELGILIENNLFESALGIENDPSDKWCENLEFKSSSPRVVDTTWSPLYGERNLVKDNYNYQVLHFVKFESAEDIHEGHSGTSYDKRRSYLMDLEVRVYNEGVAFRYFFPETSNGLFLHIEGEQTSFTMPDETMAFYERWAQGPYELLSLKNWPDECERL